jgi:UDP-N-acetylmuramoyl-tripeptide--D-alanyl-D-alanine ligase
MFLSIEEILKATGGKIISEGKCTSVAAVMTDSRKAEADGLFIPLVGERFDGHDYIAKAFENGAAAALTHKDGIPAEGRLLIRVADTLAALRGLAAYYRKKFSIPFVGITGSVGKTSTKDMVAGVLGRRLNVLSTEGNLNNEIGVPLTVFRLNEGHEAAVLEMGMSGAGEISRLTAIVRPAVAIITNIGMSHIEKPGTRQNILKAKLEILEGLDEKGLVVLNWDDNLLNGVKSLLKYRTVSYGMEEGADYRAGNINSSGEGGISFDLTVEGRAYDVHLPVPGVHNVYNALAAVAAGRELGIPMEEIIAGVAAYKPGNMRMNIIRAGGLRVINDAYNASPQSMKAALDVLEEIGTPGGRIAVLGDMLEMGEWAEEAHLEVGRYAAGKRLSRLITVGPNAACIAAGAVEAGFPEEAVSVFPSNREAARFIEKILQTGDTILIKGSRGMKMEELANRFTGAGQV